MKRRGEKDVHLALNLAVDVLHPRGRLLLASLFSTSSRATLVLSAACRACSDSRICARASASCPPAARAKIRSVGVPELRERALEVLPLLGRPARDGDLLLAAQRVVEVDADALELRRPGRERIRLVAVEHVAHRQAERVEIVLDAQQLERVLAVAIGEVRLQRAQAGDLPRDVPRIGDHGRERDDQSEQQRRRRRSALRGSPVVATSPRPRADGLSTARRSGPSSAARRPARAGAPRSGRGDSWLCIAHWVSASATVIVSGGSLNHTIDTGSASRASLRSPAGRASARDTRVRTRAAVERGEIIGLRHRERTIPGADRPEKRMLHEMNVVQPLADRLVVARRQDARRSRSSARHRPRPDGQQRSRSHWFAIAGSLPDHLARRDDLGRMALCVLGRVKEQAENGGRQTGAADLARLVERAERRGPDLRERGSMASTGTDAGTGIPGLAGTSSRSSAASAARCAAFSVLSRA